ncbi:TolC family protein [Acidipila sp. EB88]|uniref:TolC family protein n=1 Tax=Acidipila sp. EB88 TaxID=2305226 RepID=UPI0013156AF9|nr:TolC family protein [Acidipila sp. EB88]
MILLVGCVRCTAAEAQALAPAPAPHAAAVEATFTLTQMIDLALARNRDLHMAADVTDHYQQLRAEARAEYFPKIGNFSEVSHITDRQGIVLPAGVFGTPPATGAIPAESIRVDQGASTTYFASTQIKQPLSQLFAIRQANRMAESDVATSRQKEQETRLEVANTVRSLFYETLVSAKNLEAVEAQLAALKEAEHEAIAATALGSTLRSDTLEVEVDQAKALTAVAQARANLHASQLKLCDTAGIALDTRLALLPPDPPPSGFTGFPSREEALQLALAQEPRVLIAEEAVTRARAAVKGAELAYVPGISAQAHESYQSGIAFFEHNYGVFSGQVTVDLFDGGTRNAKIRDAKALLAQAETALAAQRESTRIAVEVTYDQVDEAMADLEAKQMMVKAQQENERLAVASFDNGELLPSKRDTATAARTTAEAALLESTLNLALARSQIQRVLGEIPR